jgi:hypothetical protein
MVRMKTLPSLLALSLLASLCACARQERLREIDWAKAALARNPAFEILATDETAGVFTVRDTATGITHALKLEDLVAAPRAAKSAVKPPASEQQPEAAPASAPAAAPGDAATRAVASAPQTTDGTAVEAPSQAPNDGVTLAAGPGYRIERAEDAAPPAPPAATLEGPGYSITRHDAGEGTAPSAPEAEAVAAGTERRSDPIICQGERLMRIDGETLDFSGDALIAEEGCDLFITNANIRAGGVGIIARRARVHIVNSTIDGERGSYEASEGAELYVTRTTFSGIGRRFDTARMNDLGGNKYEAD